jgi:hypothetical protein
MCGQTMAPLLWMSKQVHRKDLGFFVCVEKRINKINNIQIFDSNLRGNNQASLTFNNIKQWLLFFSYMRHKCNKYIYNYVSYVQLILCFKQATQVIVMQVFSFTHLLSLLESNSSKNLLYFPHFFTHTHASAILRHSHIDDCAGDWSSTTLSVYTIHTCGIKT